MGWIPLRVLLLGEYWIVCLDVRKLPLWHPACPDSLIPERWAGSMSRDPNATQTADFHQRWCHELNKFPVYQHQQVTGGGLGKGVENSLSIPPFCGILIWFTAQFPPEVCLQCLRWTICMIGGSRRDPMWWAAAPLSQHKSVLWILHCGKANKESSDIKSPSAG